MLRVLEGHPHLKSQNILAELLSKAVSDKLRDNHLHIVGSETRTSVT